MNRTYRPLAALIFVPGLLLAGTAYADHNGPGRSARPDRQFDVRAIAHELEDAATVLHRRAEKTAHHPSYGEERALRQLHALEERADHFHRQVEREYQNPSHTYHDYLELRDSVAAARHAMPALHALGRVEREMYRVDALMSELERYYRPMLSSRYGGYDDHGASRSRSRVWFRVWR